MSSAWFNPPTIRPRKKTSAPPPRGPSPDTREGMKGGRVYHAKPGPPQLLPGTGDFAFTPPPKPPPKPKKGESLQDYKKAAKAFKQASPEEKITRSGGFLAAEANRHSVDAFDKALAAERNARQMADLTRIFAEARVKGENKELADKEAEDYRRAHAPLKLAGFNILPGRGASRLRLAGEIVSNAPSDVPEMGKGLFTLGKQAGTAIGKDYMSGHGLAGLAGFLNPGVVATHAAKGDLKEFLRQPLPGAIGHHKRSELDKLAEPLIKSIPSSLTELGNPETWKNDPLLQLMNLGSVIFPVMRGGSIASLSRGFKAANPWMTEMQALKAATITSYRPGMLSNPKIVGYGNEIAGDIPQRLVQAMERGPDGQPRPMLDDAGRPVQMPNPRPTSRSPWGRAGQKAWERGSTRVGLSRPGSRWAPVQRMGRLQDRAAGLKQAETDAAMQHTIDTVIEGIKGEGAKGTDRLREAFRGIQRIDPKRAALLIAAMQGPKTSDIAEAGNLMVRETGKRLDEQTHFRDVVAEAEENSAAADRIQLEIDNMLEEADWNGADPADIKALAKALRAKQKVFNARAKELQEQLDFELGRKVHPVRDSHQRQKILQTLSDQFGPEEAARKIQYLDGVARAMHPDMPNRFYHDLSVRRALSEAEFDDMDNALFQHEEEVVKPAGVENVTPHYKIKPNELKVDDPKRIAELAEIVWSQRPEETPGPHDADRVAMISDLQEKYGGDRRTALPERMKGPDALNVFRLVDRLATQGEKGRFWYRESGKAILRLVGGDKVKARKLAALIAVYSPQQAVVQNIAIAKKAFDEYYDTGKITVGGKDESKIAKATAIMEGDVDSWDGRKTANFYRNILKYVDPEYFKKEKFDPNGVTADMWMARLFGYTSDIVSPGRYNVIEPVIQQIAKERGWTPDEVQAATWVAMKDLDPWDVSPNVDFAGAIDRNTLTLQLPPGALGEELSLAEQAAVNQGLRPVIASMAERMGITLRDRALYHPVAEEGIRAGQTGTAPLTKSPIEVEATLHFDVFETPDEVQRFADVLAESFDRLEVVATKPASVQGGTMRPGLHIKAPELADPATQQRFFAALKALHPKQLTGFVPHRDGDGITVMAKGSKTNGELRGFADEFSDSLSRAADEAGISALTSEAQNIGIITGTKGKLGASDVLRGASGRGGAGSSLDADLAAEGRAALRRHVDRAIAARAGGTGELAPELERPRARPRGQKALRQQDKPKPLKPKDQVELAELLREQSSLRKQAGIEIGESPPEGSIFSDRLHEIETRIDDLRRKRLGRVRGATLGVGTGKKEIVLGPRAKRKTTFEHEMLHATVESLPERDQKALADTYAGGNHVSEWTRWQHELVAEAYESWRKEPDSVPDLAGDAFRRMEKGGYESTLIMDQEHINQANNLAGEIQDAINSGDHDKMAAARDALQAIGEASEQELIEILSYYKSPEEVAQHIKNNRARKNTIVDLYRRHGLIGPDEEAVGYVPHFHTADTIGKVKSGPTSTGMDDVVGGPIRPDGRVLSSKQNKLVRHQLGEILQDPMVLLWQWRQRMRANRTIKARHWLYHTLGRDWKEGDPLPNGWDQEDIVILRDPQKQPHQISTFTKAMQKLTPERIAELHAKRADQGIDDISQILDELGIDDISHEPGELYYDPKTMKTEPAWVKEEGNLRYVHRNAAAARLGKVFSENPTGPAMAIMGSLNGLARMALIYTPGLGARYVGRNYIQNMVLLAVTNPSSFQHLVSGANRRLKEEHPKTHKIMQQQIGQFAATALPDFNMRARGGKRSPQRVERAITERSHGMGEALGKYADVPLRSAAYRGNAAKQGYVSNSDIDELLNPDNPAYDASEAGDRTRTAIAQQTRDDMIDFDALTPAEQRVLTRIFFIWPFVRGFTKWPAMYAREYPGRVALAGLAASSQGALQTEPEGGLRERYQFDIPKGVPLVGGKKASAQWLSPTGGFEDIAESTGATLTALSRGKVTAKPLIASRFAPPGKEALGLLTREQGLSDLGPKLLGEFLPGFTNARQLYGLATGKQDAGDLALQFAGSDVKPSRTGVKKAGKWKSEVDDAVEKIEQKEGPLPAEAKTKIEKMTTAYGAWSTYEDTINNRKLDEGKAKGLTGHERLAGLEQVAREHFPNLTRSIEAEVHAAGYESLEAIADAGVHKDERARQLSDRLYRKMFGAKSKITSAAEHAK